MSCKLNRIYKRHRHIEKRFDVTYTRRILREEEAAFLSRYGVDHPDRIGLLSGISFTIGGKSFHGIGFDNVNGGMEFYGSALSSIPVTISNYGESFVPYALRKPTDACYVFCDFLDYLAFLGFGSGDTLGLRQDVDCVIMNSPLNYLRMSVRTDEYESIYMFMPNNNYGRTVTKTMLMRNREHVVDMSSFYKSYKYFRDMALSVRGVAVDRGGVPLRKEALL